MIALLLACGSPSEELPPLDPPVREVTVELGDDTVVTLAAAWLEPDMQKGRGVQARAELQAAEAPTLVVTGDRSQWNLQDRVLVFDGNVDATRGPVKVRSDKLEVTYAGERVERAVATGAVRVTRGERVATGDRADLTVEDGKVVLTGTPRLKEGPHTMTGERIVLFLDDERVECERCRLEVEGAAVAPRSGSQ